MQRMFSNKALRQLIVPLVIEQALAVLVGMMDTMMVASVSEAAMSGVSLVDQINYVIICLLAALATGGAVVSSQLLGARDQKKACESANQLMLVVLALSLSIMALSLGFCRPLLSLAYGSIEKDVMDAAVTYLWITALSFPFLAVYNGAAALYRSMGKSRSTMYVSMLMNAINVAGNALLVYVFKLGVAGVAIPTLVSRAVAAVVMYAMLLNQRHEIHLIRGGYRPDFPMIRRILRIAVPSGVENSLFQLGRVLVVSIISTFGTAQIAANAVANTLDSMGVLLAGAINLAVITVVGQCVGAQDFDQVKYYARKLLLIAYAANAVMNGLVLALLNPLLSLFNLSQAAYDLGRILVIIHAGCAILLWPAAFTLPNSLRATNDVSFTMYVAIGSMAVFRILTSYILGARMGMGAIGVWIGMVIDWIFRASAFVWRWKSEKWRAYCTVSKT